MAWEEGTTKAPYVVICEGRADTVFVSRLLQHRLGVTDISVRCTHTAGPRCAGKDGLTDTLKALDAARSTIPETIRGIAILFDSDESPDDSFKRVIKLIKAAKLEYPLPDHPLEVKNGRDRPSIAIGLLPWHNRQGHLDQLIFEALQGTHADLSQPITDFEAATNHRTKEWKFGPKSKLRLRCLIAASHQRDPGVALAYYLESSDCPVDFDSACFDPLMAFLNDFRAKA
jgi:hypothetical protein